MNGVDWKSHYQVKFNITQNNSIYAWNMAFWLHQMFFKEEHKKIKQSLWKVLSNAKILQIICMKYTNLRNTQAWRGQLTNIVPAMPPSWPIKVGGNLKVAILVWLMIGLGPQQHFQHFHQDNWTSWQKLVITFIYHQNNSTFVNVHF